MKKKHGKLIKNTFALYILQFSNIIFPFLTIPYQTRIFGSSSYGKLVFALSFAAYFQILIDFGFSLSATKEVSLHRDDKNKLGEILGSVIAIKLFFAFIGLIIVLILTNYISVLNDDYKIFILCYITPFISVFFPDFIFRGIENMKTVTIQNVLAKGVFTLAIFIFVKDDSDIYLVPILTGGGYLVAIIVSWVYMVRDINIVPRIPSLESVRYHLSCSFMFFLSRVATTLYSTSNIFLLGIFLPSAQVAFYSSADKIVSTSKSCLIPISDSLFPYMVKEKDNKMVFKLLLALMPILVLGVIIIYYNAEWIVKLIFGDSFISSAIPLKVLMISIIFIFPSYLLGYPLLGSMGFIQKVNNTVIVSSLLHFFILLILIYSRQITILNVAILTVLTEFTVLVQRVYLVQKYLGGNSSAEGEVVNAKNN